MGNKLELSPSERVLHRKAQKKRSYVRHRRAVIAKTCERSRVTLLARREKEAGSARPTVCQVCEQPNKKKGNPITFDHDHKTGRFRGWLCNRCNLLLGSAGDDPVLLRALAKYLEEGQTSDKAAPPVPHR